MLSCVVLNVVVVVGFCGSFVVRCVLFVVYAFFVDCFRIVVYRSLSIVVCCVVFPCVSCLMVDGCCCLLFGDFVVRCLLLFVVSCRVFSVKCFVLSV